MRIRMGVGMRMGREEKREAMEIDVWMDSLMMDVQSIELLL